MPPQPEPIGSVTDGSVTDGGTTDRGIPSVAGSVDTEMEGAWPLAIMFQPITEETVASAFTGAAGKAAATKEAVAAALGVLLNSLT